MARLFVKANSDQIDYSGVMPSASAVSIAIWWKPTSTVDYGSIVGRAAGGGIRQNIFSRNVNKMAYYIDATGLVDVDPGSATVANGTWVHAGFSYDSVNGMKTYLNGISDGTAAANGAPVNTSTVFEMGNNVSSALNPADGTLADVAIWSTTLSADEFRALSKGVLRPFQIRPGSLGGYWPLDGYGARALDRSGRGHNGVLTGTALAAGPPLLSPAPIFVQQNVKQTASASSVIFRRSLSAIGTRVGSRQGIIF